MEKLPSLSTFSPDDSFLDRSKARVSRQKDSLFRVLDGMDVVADPLNPLPAFVWPAVLIGYAAHLGNTPEVSKKALKAEASSESLWTF